MAWWETVDWQDPINRSCSLNSGLVGWWMGTPLCFGGVRMVDLLNQNHGTLATSTRWGSIEGRPALECAGTSDAGFTATRNGIGSVWSFTTIFMVAATSSAIRCVTRYHGSAFNAPSVYHWSDNKIVAYVSGNDPSVVGPTAVAGEIYVATFCSDNKFYVNSVLYGTGATAWSSVASRTLYCGYDPFVQRLNGLLHCHIEHNRVLSQAEHIAIYNQWRTGFPDMLNHIDDPLRYAEQVAAAGNRRRRALICGRAA